MGNTESQSADSGSGQSGMPRNRSVTTLAQIADLLVQANLLADALDSFQKTGVMDNEPQLKQLQFNHHQLNVERLIDLLTKMATDRL
jgi:hypothetical protein